MLEDARKFIARVIALPEDGERAFIGVHYTFLPKKHAKGTKLPFSSKVASDIDGVVEKIQALMTRVSNKDIYVCMGTQKEHGEEDKFGGYKANKHADNIGRNKSLYIDTDFFKGGEHGYKTQAESEKAFAKFLTDSSIPEPSLSVHSGGGFHHHWVLSTPLTPAEWQPLANQLAEATRHHSFKCDVGVTTDVSRILRVPNTLNYKYKPAKSVKINKWTDRDYTPEEMATALSKYSGGVTTLRVGIVGNIDVSGLVGTKPFVAFQSTDEITELGAGISLSPPIDVNAARKECLFIDDALNTGGASLTGQPAWNMATLLATFTMQGAQAAHDMAKNNQYYNAADQDKMYARKEVERQRGVGWPKCASVYAAGSTVCVGCQHFSKGKYPFSFINQVVTPAVVNLPAITIPPDVDTIPDTYRRDKCGLIYKTETDEDGDRRVYPSDTTVMTDGILSTNPFTLHFTAVVAPHIPACGVSVHVKDIGNAHKTNAMYDALTNASVKVSDREEMGHFLMAWVDKLKASDKTFSAYPTFGWAQNGEGKTVGFAYGGKVNTPTVTFPAGGNNMNIIQKYTPRGNLDEWRKAALLVTNTKRPAMDAILASAFAAPLVFFTGEQGLYFSVYSEASGIGKTTAMRLATAVWGNPNSAMQTLIDTPGSVQNKMGVLRNLPIIWDELKGDENLRKMAPMIFQQIQGRERNRLTANVEQREAGEWQTMLVTASNDSLSDYLDEHAKGNEAGIYRLFELEAAATNTGKVTSGEAAASRMVINENYGVAGLVYTQFLGSRHEIIKRIVLSTMDKFQKELNTTEAERFWLCTPVCLYLGAEFANTLGLTNIDVPTLKDALFEQIYRMRKSIVETPRVATDTAATTLLAYLRENHRRVLWTTEIWDNPGRPPVGVVHVLPPQRLDFIDGPVAQFGKKTQTLRLIARPLYEWLSVKKIARAGFINAIKLKLGATYNAGRTVGAGIPGVAGGQQAIFDIDCNVAANEVGPLFVEAIDPNTKSNVIQGNFGGTP